MKTVMFKMMLANGIEMAVVRDEKGFHVTANGKAFFSNASYERCREVLIA